MKKHEFYLHLLDAEEGQRKVRQAMQSDKYLVISPQARPPAKLRKTMTGMKAQGVHADQVFFNRESGRPELVVGRVGKGRKLMVYRVGWTGAIEENGRVGFQRPTPPKKPRKPKRWFW